MLNNPVNDSLLARLVLLIMCFFFKFIRIPSTIVGMEVSGLIYIIFGTFHLMKHLLLINISTWRIMYDGSCASFPSEDWEIADSTLQFWCFFLFIIKLLLYKLRLLLSCRWGPEQIAEMKCVVQMVLLSKNTLTLQVQSCWLHPRPGCRSWRKC